MPVFSLFPFFTFYSTFVFLGGGGVGSAQILSGTTPGGPQCSRDHVECGDTEGGQPPTRHATCLALGGRIVKFALGFGFWAAPRMHWGLLQAGWTTQFSGLKVQVSPWPLRELFKGGTNLTYEKLIFFNVNS